MLKPTEISSQGDYEATMNSVPGGLLGVALGIATVAAVATIVFFAVGPISETESGQPGGTVLDQDLAGGSEEIPDVLRRVPPPSLLVVPFFALANGRPLIPAWVTLYRSIVSWSFVIILVIVAAMGVVGGFRYLLGGERFKTPRFFRFMICANIALGVVALLALIGSWTLDIYF